MIIRCYANFKELWKKFKCGFFIDPRMQRDDTTFMHFFWIVEVQFSWKKTLF